MNYLPKISSTLIALTVMLSGATSLKADDPKPITVPKILKVTYHIEKILPPNLVVNAIGEVTTGGYTDVKLTRVVYTKIPDDGIQDYVLTAVPPSGIASQVISQVEASDKWKDYPAWVKGIRVRGVKDGIVVVKFGQDPKPVRRRFTGTSKDGSFEKALAAAVGKLNDALPEGGVSDASATWKLVNTTGQVGSIAGLNQVSVTIVAERQPPWSKKKQSKKK